MFPGHSVDGSGRAPFVKYLLLYGFCLLATGAAAQMPSLPPFAKDETVGTGALFAPGKLATVRYTATFANGKPFDASHTKVPFRFVPGVTRLIPGWTLGLDGMRVGGRRRLTLVPGLAYDGGIPGAVPPDANLIYEVELLSIE